jgi:CubicO group peptidase (beta-lactamase class C family)
MDDDETGLEGEDVLGRISPEPERASTPSEDEPDVESTTSESEEDGPIKVTFEEEEEPITPPTTGIIFRIDEPRIIMASTPSRDISGIHIILDDTNHSASVVIETVEIEDESHSKHDLPHVHDPGVIAVARAVYGPREDFELIVNERVQAALQKAADDALVASAAADLKEAQESGERIEAFLEGHKIHSHEHFHEELHGRAATFACIMRGGRPLLHYGNPQKRCNLYSITKSFTALVIMNDVLYNRLPTGLSKIDYDIGELMEVFFCEKLPFSMDRFNGLTLPMLMNHVSGIDDIPLTAKTVIDLIVQEKNTQNIVGRFLTTYSPKAPFKYSPVLGYAMVGAIYELLWECGPYIKDTFEATFLRGIWRSNTWHWREDDGEDLCRHSFAFSEVFTTGQNMVDLGLALLEYHRPLLEHIADDTKPYPHYTKHAQSAGAASYSSTHWPEAHQEGSSEKIDYDYSEGWWIIRRSPKERYLVAIGWLGQYLMIGLDNDVVAVRQHELGKPATDADVREQARKKKNVIIPNYHEFFPAHVISFLDHLGSQ